MRYQIAELITGVVLLAGTVFAARNLANIPDDAKLFPNIVLIIMAIGSVMMMIRSLTGASRRVQGNTIENWRFTIDPIRCTGGIALFVVYLIAVEPLGYFTATALFIVAAAVVGQFTNWQALLASALGFCLFVYLMFVLLFDRALPEEFFITAITTAVRAMGSADG